MKQFAMTMALTLLLGLAAFAQSSSPNDPQSAPQGTSPSAAPAAQQTTQPAQTPDMQTPSNTAAKGEKKLKGCLRSENGKFLLEKKNGEKVELTGSQDLATHVGHTVTVRGTLENAAAGGGMASPSASASGANASPAGAGGQFTVSKLDMVSDTCSADKAKGKADKTPGQAPDHP